MRKTLLNLFAVLLLPHALAFGQASATEPSNHKTIKVPVPAGDHNPEVAALQKNDATPPDFTLTELQHAKLDAARRDIWHWQDNLNRSLNEFGALCQEAGKENKWPPITCNWDTLLVTPQPKPPGPPAGNPAPAVNPAPPAAKDNSPPAATSPPKK
jgi:hypothetical protein